MRRSLMISGLCWLCACAAPARPAPREELPEPEAERRLRLQQLESSGPRRDDAWSEHATRLLQGLDGNTTPRELPRVVCFAHGCTAEQSALDGEQLDRSTLAFYQADPMRDFEGTLYRSPPRANGAEVVATWIVARDEP